MNRQVFYALAAIISLRSNPAAIKIFRSAPGKFSPEGDKICTSLTNCRDYDPEAWKHESNTCDKMVEYKGSSPLGKSIKVYYDDDLDGGGSMMAPGFVQVVSQWAKKTGTGRVESDKPPFNRAYEWCTGPGFIAFAHMAEGLVSRLLLSDINPRAVKCLHKTVEENNLSNSVDVYLGKDFLHVPEPNKDEDRIDLVLGNPPNYMKIDHETLSKDLRPADPNWSTHDAFYQGITKYLSKDATLFIEEVAPEQKDISNVMVGLFTNGNYDTRPEVPRTVFKNMAAKQDLEEVAFEDLNGLSKVMVFRPKTALLA